MPAHWVAASLPEWGDYYCKFFVVRGNFQRGTQKLFIISIIINIKQR